MSTKKLLDRHRSQLAGIPDPVIEELGFYTEIDPEALIEALNIDVPSDFWDEAEEKRAEKRQEELDGLVPALAIPFPGEEDYVIYRPDHARVNGAWEMTQKVWRVVAPDGRTFAADPSVKNAYLAHRTSGEDGSPVKYENPRGVPVPLYVPSRAQNNRHPGPLFIYEGAKKAASGHGLGLNSVGLGGVGNWRAPKDDNISAADPSPKVKPDLLGEARAAENKAVIIFDTPDVIVNMDVIGEAVALAQALAAEGIEAQVGYVPEVPGQAKSGFDDWVAKAAPDRSSVVSKLRLRPADPVAQIQWAEDQKKSRSLVRELSTWAYTWVRSDEKLFRAWAKKAATKLTIAPETFEEAVEHIATPDGVTTLAYCVPSEGFIYRASDAEPFGIKVVQRDAAITHLEAKGMRPKQAAKVVAQKAHTMPVVYGFDIRPGSAAVFDGPEGKMANLYVPPALIPARGQWPRIQRLIEWLIPEPQGRVWFFNWVAAKLQSPGTRLNTSTILQGTPGSGKDTLALILFHLLGVKNCAVIGQDDLDCQFNHHFAGKLFVFANEVTTRENLNDRSGPLKAYLASPRISVNMKGQPQFFLDNRSCWLFATNSQMPVRLDHDDRRHTVFANYAPITAEHREMCRSLYKADNSDLTPDALKEVQAYGWDLMFHAVDRKLIAVPFENAARRSLIEMNKTTVQSFADVIREIGAARAVRRHGVLPISEEWDFDERGVHCETLYSAYRSFCESRGSRYVNENIFGVELRREFPSLAPREQSRIRNAKGRRVYVYKGLPSTTSADGAEIEEEGLLSGHRDFGVAGL